MSNETLYINKGKFFMPEQLDRNIPKSFPTLNEAVKYAKELLEEYRSSAIVRGGWHTDMDNFRIVDAAGTVYCRFKRINEISRPDDIDEEGYSRSVGEYWDPDWEYTCDYELREVNEK